MESRWAGVDRSDARAPPTAAVLRHMATARGRRGSAAHDRRRGHGSVPERGPHRARHRRAGDALRARAGSGGGAALRATQAGMAVDGEGLVVHGAVLRKKVMPPPRSPTEGRRARGQLVLGRLDLNGLERLGTVKLPGRSGEHDAAGPAGARGDDLCLRARGQADDPAPAAGGGSVQHRACRGFGARWICPATRCTRWWRGTGWPSWPTAARAWRWWSWATRMRRSGPSPAPRWARREAWR